MESSSSEMGDSMIVQVTASAGEVTRSFEVDIVSPGIDREALGLAIVEKGSEVLLSESLRFPDDASELYWQASISGVTRTGSVTREKAAPVYYTKKIQMENGNGTNG